MKIAKLIFLGLISFILCGCSIKYTLKIKNDFTFEESIQVNGQYINYYNNSNDKDIKEYIESNFKDLKNYNLKKISVVDSYYNFVVESKIKGEDNFLSNAYTLNYLYNTNDVEYLEDGKVAISLKNIEDPNAEEHMVLEFDKITVEIKSDKVIENSNADKISGKTHIWEMQDSNIKDVYFELTDKRVPNYFLFVFIILVIITGAASVVIYNKNKKANMI